MATYGEMYDEMLDEVLGPVTIGSLEYEASRVMREVDPVAYRCGFNDWTGGGGFECDECGDSFCPDVDTDDEYPERLLCDGFCAHCAAVEAETDSADDQAAERIE